MTHDPFNTYPDASNNDRLDPILRTELRWDVPPELAARLLQLVPGHTLLPPIPVRPKPWYSLLVLVLTAVTIGLSLAVAWQFYGLLGAELGLDALLMQLRDAPALALQQLYAAIPASRNLVAGLALVRDQLHWLLLAAVLWLAFDTGQGQQRLAPKRT
jgi:hypothetical protein